MPFSHAVSLRQVLMGVRRQVSSLLVPACELLGRRGTRARLLLKPWLTMVSNGYSTSTIRNISWITSRTIKRILKADVYNHTLLAHAD